PLPPARHADRPVPADAALRPRPHATFPQAPRHLHAPRLRSGLLRPRPPRGTAPRAGLVVARVGLRPRRRPLSPARAAGQPDPDSPQARAAFAPLAAAGLRRHSRRSRFGHPARTASARAATRRNHGTCTASVAQATGGMKTLSFPGSAWEREKTAGTSP